MSGNFSDGMMKDWVNDDIKLLGWREETGKTDFENTKSTDQHIKNQDYFDRGIVMIAFVKSGVELAFETMVEAGIIEESAYYESLHELPLIANLISRKKLYEMNSIISDTAEYGCYLFCNKAKPLLKNYIDELNPKFFADKFEQVNSSGGDTIKKINFEIKNHSVEKIGAKLRKSMTAMKNLF